MGSIRSRILKFAARHFISPRLNTNSSPDEQRRFLRAISRLQPATPGVSAAGSRIGGVSGEMLTPSGSSPSRCILFLHGGAYCVSDHVTHRSCAARLALTAQANVFVADYRLAPEHPFPAAVDDASHCWQGLLEEGFESREMAVAGDSAGGGLALALAFRLRDAAAPLPRAMVLFCPWTDATLSSESMSRNRLSEPLLTREWIELGARYYAAEEPLDNPMISPLFGNFVGLPPMLIQAASDDVLLDDARRLHKAAVAAGVEAQIDVFADMSHDFQLFPGHLPEARRALILAGAYLKAQMA